MMWPSMVYTCGKQYIINIGTIYYRQRGLHLGAAHHLIYAASLLSHVHGKGLALSRDALWWELGCLICVRMCLAWLERLTHHLLRLVLQ